MGCRFTPNKRQNLFEEGETPKFEGHMMQNEDEYHNLSCSNLDIVLEYHNSPLEFLITCIPAIYESTRSANRTTDGMLYRIVQF